MLQLIFGPPRYKEDIITYPYTSNKVSYSSFNKNVLNFYGTRIKFIFPCRQNYKNVQQLDMNYNINDEQKVNYNQSARYNESDLESFMDELSDYKQYAAACYNDQYQSVVDNLWSPGTEEQVLDFVHKTYQNEIQLIKVQSLFDAINRTIANVIHKEQLRIYKLNRPFGSGQGPNAKLQIFIQDSEYFETIDEAIQLLKKYKNINQNILNQLSFSIFIFGQQVNKSIEHILQSVIQIKRIQLNISEYVNMQMHLNTSVEPYFTVKQHVDSFNQTVISICNLVHYQLEIRGVICSSFPIKHIFNSMGVAYIVDTSKELCMAQNTPSFFNYNYFLTTLKPQQFYHMNQYNRTKIIIQKFDHLIQNVNGYLRLILKIRDFDKKQYKLIQQLQPSQELYTFSRCSIQQGFVFYSDFDCTTPNNIFQNQEEYLEAAILLSDVTFNTLKTLKAKLTAADVEDLLVGRIARNNMSIVYADYRISNPCEQQIQDLIRDYPNRPDFTTNKFSMHVIFCYYHENGVSKSGNFTLFFTAHTNYFMTDFILLKSDSPSLERMFNGRSYNILTANMTSLFPLQSKNIQPLFTSGALLCKIIDENDFMHKRITLTSVQKLNQTQFKLLETVNGIVFQMKEETVKFNCSEQIFSNDVMKNSQERAYYFQNVFQNESVSSMTQTSTVSIVLTVLFLSLSVGVLLSAS
ncbi:Hypothetical_protein [Hexamita inflata]|uniref:Hypothetical_protein n=1 Tax=Hexamita inflata TaxID=28002 RepID=A0AA86QWE7_9EUKA|nr:Hypothetical protein HINF_LOCUS48294 [Hexamita inflata]